MTSETEKEQEKEKTLTRLSIVIPCFNEEMTLRTCVENLLDIADDSLSPEVIIVDDCSTDSSPKIAAELQARYPGIVTVLKHKKNQGKGAALRTGFQKASGDFAAVHDADLEYDPNDLKRLLKPLINGDADVVFGSRFLSHGAHRVLYFWHYMGNRLLTFISNMFTDLNLTDMETCYKVFRREVIQGIEIQEDRFGFEPEIVAKVAHQRLRVYEMGISYYGRTYEEGKKIGVKDGFRALYCIFRYNAHKAPVPVQFMLYLFIGGLAAGMNLAIFLGLFSAGFSITVSALTAFFAAAILNYQLCVTFLFRHRARWDSGAEIFVYTLAVAAVAALDLWFTKLFLVAGSSSCTAKLMATGLTVIFNFIGRRFIVFPEQPSGHWSPRKGPGAFSK